MEASGGAGVRREVAVDKRRNQSAIKILVSHNTIRYLELHYGDLIEAFVKDGHEVVALAPYDDSREKLEKRGVTCIDIRLSRRGMNPLREAASLMAIRKVVKEQAPDVIFGFSIKPVIYCGFVARLFGIVEAYSMITGLGYVFLSGGHLRKLVRQLVVVLYRIAITRNKCVFFQNAWDRDTFINYGIIEKGRTYVVPGTGIDVRSFTPDDRSVRADVFVMVARLIKEKGVHEYVEAARSLKSKYEDKRFFLVGPFDDNPSRIERDEVEKWVGEGVIEYLGEVEDVRPVLYQSDVFVLPSYYREGLPRTLLEAMALGRPVVTTDWPGCRDCVENGKNGLLVPVKDARELQKALETFIRDPGLAREMGGRGRRMVEEEYSVDRVNTLIQKRMGLGA